MCRFRKFSRLREIVCRRMTVQTCRQRAFGFLEVPPFPRTLKFLRNWAMPVGSSWLTSTSGNMARFRKFSRFREIVCWRIIAHTCRQRAFGFPEVVPLPRTPKFLRNWAIPAGSSWLIIGTENILRIRSTSQNCLISRKAVRFFLPFCPLIGNYANQFQVTTNHVRFSGS